VYLLPLCSHQHGDSQAEVEQPPGGEPDVDLDVSLVHALLQPLVGRDLDYWSFGRDTPPGERHL
jgi:hypothetical protein